MHRVCAGVRHGQAVVTQSEARHLHEFPLEFGRDIARRKQASVA